MKCDYIWLLICEPKIKYSLLLISDKYSGKAINDEIKNVVINNVYILRNIIQNIISFGIR